MKGKNMNNTTTSKTFADGLIVRILNGRIGTNCKHQSSWIDGEKLTSSVTTLVELSPLSCDSAESFMILAVQQQRAAWFGLQQYR